jgi:type IV secretory pathway VirB10-like protein
VRLAVALIIVMVTGCAKRQPLVTAPRTQVQPPHQAPAAKKASAPRPAEPARTPTAVLTPAPPPKLEPLISPEQREAHARELEATIRRAEENATALRVRGSQLKDIKVVDSLIRQARTAQAANDLPSARSFASRAEVLSTDLLRR